MAPTWEEFANAVNGSIHVGKVNVPENEELGIKYKIRGFPTVKYFREQKVYNYEGPRTVKDFKEFCEVGYTQAEEERY